MPPEDIGRIQGRLLRNVQKAHVGFLRIPTAFAVIARRTCGHDVVPDVRTTLKAGHDVIDGETNFTATAVLTRIIVTTEYLSPSELDMRPRSAYLELQTDHGGAGNLKRYSSEVSPAIGHHGCFSTQDQDHRPSGRAHVDRLEVRVEYQDGFAHGRPNIPAIIA